MFFLSRSALVTLASIGLMACAAPAPSPTPVPSVESGRSSHPTGIALRDMHVRVIEGSPLQVSLKGDPR
ncbi:MAG TPA: hypothetical protein VFU39_09795, partial [Sulfuricaulis sp.]|nr:hypothetical protein [Sulfuricaulis sp.]